MCVWQIVDEPLLLQTDMNPAERRARVKELLRTVQLDPELFAGRFPHELSGGQQQRVGVARAIATHPRVLVLDEPTSALDASVRGQIIALLRRLQHELGLSYLFISHDLRTVRSICGRVAVMHLGRLVEVGPTDQIFRSPRHEYTQSLLRSRLSLVPGERRRLRQADE
jgi:ABC-type microcin C transport system duplicated ATPase subunit YejF